MPLWPAARFGAYEIVGAIGAGGMGEAYRARDTRLAPTVAIKVLPAAVAQDPALRVRFMREARVISSLNQTTFVPLDVMALVHAGLHHATRVA